MQPHTKENRRTKVTKAKLCHRLLYQYAQSFPKCAFDESSRLLTIGLGLMGMHSSPVLGTRL